ncbi:MAG TPA: hypothetical protein VML19_26390, partial [Verrucomicrobiae bacterium]|nr:hypothetical protein [Verrucomicrobiae bacterium]
RPMAFVQLGAPGIDVLRDVDDVKRRILEQAGADRNQPMTCAAWNSVFTRATGVYGPEACWELNGQVSFDTWFNWLKNQK